jgi:putative salt-induced outer membrane protein YdiY
VELPKAVFNEKLRWQIIENLALFQSYSHQGDLNNYQFNFSGGIENRLIKELFIKIEYKIEEDTEVNYDDKGFYNRSLIVSLLQKFK